MSKNNAYHRSNAVALISAPWPLFDRPSIQLGTLKSYLQSRVPKIDVSSYHFYLDIAAGIGYSDYQQISKRTWLAESVYAALLYPERREAIENLFYKEAMFRSRTLSRRLDFNRLVREVKIESDTSINRVDWNRFILAGFTMSLCQLTSSLYYIHQIKKRFPKLKVAVGGTTLSGIAGRNVLNVFPAIDFIINGEGENPLSALVSKLRQGDDNHSLSNIPGVTSHESTDETNGAVLNQVPDLKQIPLPDYEDYFERLKSFNPERRFFPTIPIEASRGCWWRKPDRKSDSKGCAFCNLNLQWKGYRSKTPAQVVSEIDTLTSKYKILSIAFMDNVLPQKPSKRIFENLSRLKKDLKLFAEIRANFPLESLRAMKSAGMEKVQIGIEALSTQLLSRMNKGTTAIENIETMKHCEMLGIENDSNLILQFPGSTPSEVTETIKNIEFAMYYQPLRPVAFWLGLASPVWQHHKDYNILNVFNHSNYSILFPQEICNPVKFIIQAYRGDMTFQKKLWKPVKQKIDEWQTQYSELAKDTPILSYRDGRAFIIIRQKRRTGDPMTHRLEGTSREIYLFCHTRRSVDDILQQFQGITSDQINRFLRMMVDKRLMFQEKDQYLSLAIPATH